MPQIDTKNLQQRLLQTALQLNFRAHLCISLLLRCALIYYGELQDARSTVPYTDIDYKVVTDGARHVLAGASPFERHTYRYSPLLAYLQIPNVLLHPAMGKYIYVCFDIFVAMLIYALVQAELQSQCRKAVHSLLHKMGKTLATAKSVSQRATTDERNRPEKIARASACFWLYNPLTAVISTRGNGDSFSSFFVILSVYLLIKSADSQHALQHNLLVFSSGLVHGFAIHLRLYPLVFSLAYFLCLSPRIVRSSRHLLLQICCPTLPQLLLVAGTALSFGLITCLFYQLYGWQYIHEAYLYHFVRRDVRHNFSIYFLIQYLASGDFMGSSGSSFWLSQLQKLLLIAPQIVLIVYLSLSFGQFRQTLPFCVFALAFVMVTFNTVVTSQYFVWYLALLPLCLNNLQSISLRKSLAYFVLWLLAQGLWLLPAYLLEFKTWNTFYWIGAQSELFFIINNMLLARFIQHYSFTSFKINTKKLF